MLRGGAIATFDQELDDAECDSARVCPVEVDDRDAARLLE
jgi:hypothetical protein